MIKVYVSKNKKVQFALMLANKDAEKFLRKFEGKKEFFGDAETFPFDYIMECSKPENYRVEVFQGRDDFNKGMDLMMGEW